MINPPNAVLREMHMQIDEAGKADGAPIVLPITLIIVKWCESRDIAILGRDHRIGYKDRFGSADGVKCCAADVSQGWGCHN